MEKEPEAFGNATTADVLSGKTFTSAAGLRLTGTATKDPWKVVTNVSFDYASTSKTVGLSISSHLRVTDGYGNVFVLPARPIYTASSLSFAAPIMKSDNSLRTKTLNFSYSRKDSPTEKVYVTLSMESTALGSYIEKIEEIQPA